MHDFKLLTDDQLFSMAKHFGKNALIWRRKFTGLLPEIYRRKLYEKKGFESIFVFAKKMCGLSEAHVKRALNLEKQFSQTPILKKMLTHGEVSIHKLARVASIASAENEEELAEKIKVLPQSAIETLVRDEKFARIENGDGLFEPKIEGKFVRAHKLEELDLAEPIINQLAELQEKGIDLNEFLQKALERREKEIEGEKGVIAKTLQKTHSRYISAKTKRVLKKEHGTKCSIRGCKRESTVIHHTQTFALSKTHDPNFLAPLCKEHHAIAHSINIAVNKRRRALHKR